MALELTTLTDSSGQIHAAYAVVDRSRNWGLYWNGVEGLVHAITVMEAPVGRQVKGSEIGKLVLCKRTTNVQLLTPTIMEEFLRGLANLNVTPTLLKLAVPEPAEEYLSRAAAVFPHLKR